MMRALVLFCTLLLATVHAQGCVQTQFCIVGYQWDPVLCKCAPKPTTAAPTVAPVVVVTLSFNATIITTNHTDSIVGPLLIAGMRQIAIGDPDAPAPNQGAGIAPSDVRINKHHVKRLTSYTILTTNPDTYASTWSFKIGFTGQVMPEDPVMGATGESTVFLIQAFSEAQQFKLTLKLLSAKTLTPPPTQQPNTRPVIGNTEDNADDTTTTNAFTLQFTTTIIQSKDTMTTHTCDDGIDIPATQSCPVSMTVTPSSSSTHVVTLVGSIVGGVALLLVVVGTVMVVLRRRATAAKANPMDTMQAQQQQQATTQV